MSSLIPREDGRDDDDAAGGVVNPAADFGDDDVGNKAENNRNGSSGRGSSCVATPPAKQLEELSTMEREALRERVHAAELKKCADFVRIEVRYTKDAFRRLFQAQEVLEQLFKLFDHDRRGLLLQEDWIEFLKQRLTNEKEIDFAEQLESVAYCRCGEEAIKPDQFIQIFNTKGIIDKLYRLIDRENLGTVSSKQIMDFLASISNTSPRAGFDKGSLEWLEKLFRQTVGDEKEIRREDFKKIVISKNPFFTERVFQIFDKDNSGTISLQEFLDSMHQFAGQSPDDKIRFLFKVYDIDGDGLIQLKELQDVIRACMEENGMQFSEEQISDLTMALFEDADPNHKGTITYEALKNQLEKHGGLLENLSISIDRWLVPPKPKPKRSLFRKLMNWRPYYLSKPYVKNNYVYLVFLGCFLLVNLVLFVTRSMQYKDSNYYVIFARACGQCLNFNCMFILVLMLRQCITFLRTRGFGAFLPLDHHIYLHKFTGILIFAYSFLHTIMHLLNFSLIVTYSKEFNNYDETNNTMHFTTLEWIFTTKPRLFGLIPGYANPTGVILVIILIVMFFCSQSCVRRGGSFEIFYWTHLLYVPFWILLILHGPKFWIWFLIPGIIYLLERTYRIIETKSQRGKTYISSGLLLPSKVTHLVIKRPPTFDFHAGDYVFVNIPAIAKYEWHPFTISSAPEQEDYLWLHIRGVGEWTNRLYEYFESEQVRLNEGELTGLCARQPSVRGSEGPVQRLKTTITRTFSNKDGSKKQDVQLLAYHTENQQQQQKNEEGDATESDGEISGIHPCSSKTSYQELSKKMSQERRLQRILFPNEKAKLEKSISMPDIQTRAKKKERLKYIRDYVRSESERNFSECQIKQARLKSFYSSPQNKSLAISFRYMRKKPPIIAFKTPSMEDCGSQMSSPGASSRPLLPENQAEEGRVGQEFFPGKSTTSSVEKNSGYPIGKPLEPIMEMAIRKVNNDYGNDDDVDDEELEQLRELLEANAPKGPEIYLDGPYGAPSSHIFRAQHAVLIATGIGVTPFASILQSIMFRYWKARQTCPKCNYSWASELSVMKLQKVDFFWINRDQKSFEWFVNLLSQLEIEQAELGGAMERFLEMHMYITSALQKTDMKAVGLQLALDLLHEKEKRDLITGLKTRTNAGRPNWDKVFDQLDNQGKGKVTVFYCGPPQLGRILRVKCDQHNFIFRKETF